MRRPSRRSLALLAAGALLAVLAEEAWRHDHLRLSLDPAPDDTLVEWGMHDFYGSATLEGGLGPVYNATSCATCHYLPETGGTGAQAVLRIATTDGNTPSVFPLSSIDAARCQPAPPGGRPLVRRIPTPLFGAGLIAAIPDETIAALADPGDRNGDGVRGRAAAVTDPVSGRVRVGRFGWKAQDATLAAAVARAYAFEMGVTNALYPHEIAVGLDAARLAECDAVADPEDERDAVTGSTSVDRLTAFVAQLAPPPPAPAMPAGERLFESAGCAACHRPAIGAARPYSDFLLHDVGTGDGVAQGDAGAAEFRTAPLWGLGSRRLLMHDGGALTIEEAIARHAGEAARSRATFDGLGHADRQALLDFLRRL